MKKQYVGLSALVVTLVLCGGCRHAARLGPRDLEELGQMAAALATADEVGLPNVMESGLIEVSLGRSASCQMALKEFSHAGPVTRMTLGVQAIKNCHFSCPPAIDKLANVAEDRRLPMLIEQCDNAGPDPIFGGALASRRGQLDLLDYAVFRFLLDDTRIALDHDGSEKAKAAWSRFESLLPRLVTSLVARAPTLYKID